ncbi:hypothetical protein JCM8097_001448 [Rhodosporidiobolus ruineniae]
MSALPPAARAFCTAFNCSTPFVLPPMATVTGAELASAVFKVGGVGLIGAGHQPLEYLKKDVEAAREILKLGEEDELPLGVGLLTFLWEPAFLSSLSLSANEATALGDSFLRYVLFDARFKYFWPSFSGSRVCVLLAVERVPVAIESFSSRPGEAGFSRSSPSRSSL